MGVYLGWDNSAMKGPCPDGYHVPTHDELASLTQAGLSLGAITSGSGNGFKTYLKMPFAGYRFKTDATVTNQNSSGCYFSCNAKNYRQIYSLRLGASYLDYDYTVSSDGCSIRPFKDYPVKPDSSWTTLKSGSGNAGIFWSSTLGLISISADGNNWITIADKNLGATTVYNNGDTLSEANCGKYYQRGNNYGFPRTGSVTTSSTKVDPTGYGPGNYYSSSTFVIVTQYTWYTPDNQNLRGGVTGIIPAELKNAYIGGVYEYAYDFRNKSTSQITTDGWSYSAGDTPSFGTYGVYGSNSTLRLSYDISSYITNAKKIKIGFTTTSKGSTSAAGVRLAKTVTINSRVGLTGPGYNNTSETYMQIYDNMNSYSGITSGTYQFEGIIDLENKTWKLSITGKSDQTGTLTDTQVSNILNNTTKLFVYVSSSDSNSNYGMSTVNLTVDF